MQPNTEPENTAKTLRVFGLGILTIFVMTIALPVLIYTSLYLFAVETMWSPLLAIVGTTGYDSPAHIVFVSQLFEGLLGCAALALAIWTVQKMLRKRPIGQIITSAPAFRWKRFWAGCLVFTLIYILYWLIVIGFALIQSEPGIFEQPSLLEKLQLQNISPKQAFWAALPVVLIFTPLNAALQEIVFRGFTDQQVSKLVPHKFTAFLLSAVIFAAWHYGSPGQGYGWFGFYLGFIVFAVCMSLISDHDKGLEAAIGIHTANNILATLAVGNPHDGFSATYWFQDLTMPNYGALSVFVDICMYGTCLILMLNWNLGLSPKRPKP